MTSLRSGEIKRYTSEALSSDIGQTQLFSSASLIEIWGTLQAAKYRTGPILGLACQWSGSSHVEWGLLKSGEAEDAVTATPTGPNP
ncbi:hypothetical protein N7453_008197 [Penicillium expansum]|nr:hypothetical protein N7453_008197 [Penicillium expansum]